MFIGEYHHTLDEKGRLTIPARLREGLSPVLYLTRGQDTNLAIFPQEAWEELKERLGQMSSTSRERRSFARWFFGGATEVTLDKAGRILVPAYLREYAEIDGDVVVVGADDLIELWNPQRWAIEYERIRQRQLYSDTLPDEQGS